MNKIVQKKTGTAGRRPKSRSADMGTRAALLAAARKVFANRGFEGTSIREIAEAAKVNKAMIYYHFKDKVDLYRAVLSSSFSELQTIWDDDIFSSSASAREKLQTYIEGFIRFEQGNEELRRIFSTDFTGFGKNVKWTADNYFAESYARLAAIIKEGMRSGEIKKVKPQLAIITLIGMIGHSFMFKPIAEYVSGSKLELSSSGFGAFVTGLFFDGLAPRNGRNGTGHRGIGRRL